MKTGWKTSTLGDTCEMYQPKTISGKELVADGPYPVFGANGIIGRYDKFNHEDPQLLVTCRGATCGSVNISEPKSWITGNAMVVRPKNHSLEMRYLEYLFRGGIDISKAITGAAQPQITRTNLEPLKISYPESIPEQKRIVGLLDEAFEGVATAKANTEKNLKNARDIFESHLQAVFAERGMRWERVTLATLLERGWIESHLDGNHGGDYPRKQEFISEGVPYISANCIDDERVDMTRAKYLSESRAAKIRKGIARDNDVLFAHNATVGPVAILHTNEAKVILGTSLTYYRCNRERILPEYLAHYMRSFGFKTQYLQVMRQSTRNQVPITKQRELWHVIPPLEEQQRIVGALDGLLENGQRLATIYKGKIAELESLKKSLLHQAFTGNL